LKILMIADGPVRLFIPPRRFSTVLSRSDKARSATFAADERDGVYRHCERASQTYFRRRVQRWEVRDTLRHRYRRAGVASYRTASWEPRGNRREAGRRPAGLEPGGEERLDGGGPSTVGGPGRRTCGGGRGSAAGGRVSGTGRPRPTRAAPPGRAPPPARGRATSGEARARVSRESHGFGSARHRQGNGTHRAGGAASPSDRGGPALDLPHQDAARPKGGSNGSLCRRAPRSGWSRGAGPLGRAPVFGRHLDRAGGTGVGGLGRGRGVGHTAGQAPGPWERRQEPHRGSAVPRPARPAPVSSGGFWRLGLGLGGF